MGVRGVISCMLCVGRGSEGSVAWQACSPKWHANNVYSVAFSPDGKWIVSGSFDRLVKIWNAKTGAEVRTDPGSCVGPYPISFRRVPIPGLRTRTRSRSTSSSRSGTPRRVLWCATFPGESV